jgi:hypothetical protein
MKTKLQLIQGAAVLIAIFALGVLASPTTAFSQSDQSSQDTRSCQGPTGSWRYSVPQAGAPDIQGFDTYSADGGYATVDVIGGLFQTTGIGSWKCTGHNTWELTFFTLNYDPTSGALLGTLEYRQTAKLDRDGDTFSGSGDFEYYDAAGVGVGSGSYTITATRIIAGSPLPAHL